MKTVARTNLWSRFSLTTKILVVFLGLSVASLAMVGGLSSFALWGLGDYALYSQASLGEQAVSDSTGILEDVVGEDILWLARDHAAISDVLFKNVESHTNMVAEYASRLWSSPPLSSARRSHSISERPSDVYEASVYWLAPGVAAVTSAEEVKLSGDMDDIFIPVLANNPNIAGIYVSTESGLFRMYPWTENIAPAFDARKRPWYQQAVNTGKAGWTDTLRRYAEAMLGDEALLKARAFQAIYPRAGENFSMIFEPGSSDWKFASVPDGLITYLNEDPKSVFNFKANKVGKGVVAARKGNSLIRFYSLEVTGR